VKNLLRKLIPDEHIPHIAHELVQIPQSDGEQSSHIVGVHEVGVHEVGVHEVGVHEVGVHEVGVHEVGVHEVGVHEVGVLQSAGADVCAEVCVAFSTDGGSNSN